MVVPQSTKEFLKFMEDFIAQVRVNIKFMRPQDVEHVLDLLAQRYEEWMEHRDQFTVTAPNNVVMLRKTPTTKENHHDDQD